MKSLTLKQVMAGDSEQSRVKIMFTFKAGAEAILKAEGKKVQESAGFHKERDTLAQLNQVCKNIRVRLIRQA